MRIFVNNRVESTEATVTGLQSAHSYELLLLAGRDNETEQIGVRMTASTSTETTLADSTGTI